MLSAWDLIVKDAWQVTGGEAALGSCTARSLRRRKILLRTRHSERRSGFHLQYHGTLYHCRQPGFWQLTTTKTIGQFREMSPALGRRVLQSLR